MVLVYLWPFLSVFTSPNSQAQQSPDSPQKLPAQAVRRFTCGSLEVSENSCHMMAVVPSAPGSLLGLPLSPSTTLLSQPCGHWSGSPTMEYLMVSPLTMEVDGPWYPQNWL